MVVRVTSNADAGPGSFRQAVLDANADPSIDVIRFAPDIGVVALQQTVTYSGAQGLSILGSNATLDGGALGAGESAFVTDGGSNLNVRFLAVQNAAGTGITVAVPDAATGVIAIRFDNVRIWNNGFHGVLINDQKEYFNDPNSTSQDGSDASIDLRVTASRIEGNGLQALDNDGFRVNEGGLGEIVAFVDGSVFTGNGADGLELDERADGSARFQIQKTELTFNGAFDVVTDPDDGIDVDESGNGDIRGRFERVIASDNSEQGVDLNENDAGDLRVEMFVVEASRNPEEGIEFEEDDDDAGGGDLWARLTNITTNGNGSADGDAGLKLREKGDGNLDARIVNAVSNGNAIRGILLREDGVGDLDGTILNAIADGNGDDGIAFDENSDGDLRGIVRRSTSSNNAGAGVLADQQTPGIGSLLLQALTAPGNADGPVKLVNVVVDP